MSGLWFNEPEFGVCSIVSVAQPYELVVGAGNRTDADYLPPGWHQCVLLRTASGRTERVSVSEAARWLEASPHTPPPLVPARAPPPFPLPPIPTPLPAPPSPIPARPQAG
jgi:hypothetical protein